MAVRAVPVSCDMWTCIRALFAAVATRVTCPLSCAFSTMWTDFPFNSQVDGSCVWPQWQGGHLVEGVSSGLLSGERTLVPNSDLVAGLSNDCSSSVDADFKIRWQREVLGSVSGTMSVLLARYRMRPALFEARFWSSLAKYKRILLNS